MRLLLNTHAFLPFGKSAIIRSPAINATEDVLDDRRPFQSN